MRGGGVEWREVRAKQERLAAFDVDVRLFQLRPAGAHRFNLPALQHETRFVTLLDEIFEARLAVLGDDTGCFGSSFAHGVRLARCMPWETAPPSPTGSWAASTGPWAPVRRYLAGHYTAQLSVLSTEGLIQVAEGAERLFKADAARYNCAMREVKHSALVGKPPG